MFTNRILNREIMKLSFKELKKNLSSNYLYKTNMFFFSKHNRKGHHHEKTYRRIWPAAKHLMIKHNIKEFIDKLIEIEKNYLKEMDSKVK